MAQAGQDKLYAGTLFLLPLVSLVDLLKGSGLDRSSFNCRTCSSVAPPALFPISPSFARSCCPAQLPIPFNVCQRGDERRPPQLKAVLRSCHTSYLGTPYTPSLLKQIFCVHSKKKNKCRNTTIPLSRAWSQTNRGNSTPSRSDFENTFSHQKRSAMGQFLPNKLTANDSSVIVEENNRFFSGFFKQLAVFLKKI